MKTFLILIFYVSADLASFNRYSNNALNLDIGLSKTNHDPLLQYKLKLATKMIRESKNPAFLKRLSHLLSKRTTKTNHRRNQYLKRFGVAQ